jgi:hypothetical protein
MTVGKTSKAKTAVRRYPSATAGQDPAFGPIVAAFRDDPKVVLSKMFGSTGLKVNGKVFAMLVKGELVVKLPEGRVASLIAARHGERFDPGHGRVMKEWVAIRPSTRAAWLRLAREALTFIAQA